MGCCGSDSVEEAQNFRSNNQAGNTQNAQTVKVDKKDNTKSAQEQNRSQNQVQKVVSKSKSKYEIFVESALNMHNQYRAQHGAEPLTVSEDLNKIAQDYANHIAKINQMVHSQNKYKGEHLGENIYWCSGMPIEGAAMTTSWYDEIKDYNFNKPGFKNGTGHFTQVVWKGSKQVGFGYAQSSDGGYFGVANYYPGGNINTPEYFRENVLKKKT